MGEFDHFAAGDSLTVLQEYRGYVLDGGGHLGNGTGGHSGGVKRLSVNIKELLVEVDLMKDLDELNDKASLKTAMNLASKKFSDGVNGSRAQLYFVIDQNGASGVTASIPSGPVERETLMTGNRNAMLEDEFVHLMYIDSSSDDDESPDNPGVYALGTSSVYGSIIYVSAIESLRSEKNKDFDDVLVSTTLHELTHLLLVGLKTPEGLPIPGWYYDEHIRDGDGDGINNEGHLPSDLNQDDVKYLMYQGDPTPNGSGNTAQVIYAQSTIEHMNFASKLSVERK